MRGGAFEELIALHQRKPSLALERAIYAKHRGISRQVRKGKINAEQAQIMRENYVAHNNALYRARMKGNLLQSRSGRL
jgi:hypothetical protein